MLVFIVLFGVPFVLAFVGTTLIRRVPWYEVAIRAGVQALVALTCMYVIYRAGTDDTEVWSGIVVEKEHVRVSCSHSYQCNCRPNCTTDSKGNQSCTTVCDTCYEHSYDVDWRVLTSNDETITIDRIDRQGTSEPPRWRQVRIGEPTAYPHTFTNYIKAAPDTLFRHQGLRDQYAGKLPAYPDNFYDYYHIDRFVSLDVPVPDARAWSDDLAALNADMGKAKQVNMIVVLTKQPSEDWFYALEETWVGGKKNDVTLVVSVDDGMKPRWVNVMAWATDNTFKVKLRDAVMDAGQVSRGSVLTALRQNVSDHFRRKPMAEFEYLKASMVPSSLQWVICLLIGVAVALGLAWLFTHLGFESSYGFRHNRRRW